MHVFGAHLKEQVLTFIGQLITFRIFHFYANFSDFYKKLKMKVKFHEINNFYMLQLKRGH